MEEKENENIKSAGSMIGLLLFTISYLLVFVVSLSTAGFSTFSLFASLVRLKRTLNIYSFNLLEYFVSESDIVLFCVSEFPFDYA